MRVSLLGGPYDRQSVDLSKTPPRIQIGDDIYYRIDDPDSGECLGAYFLPTANFAPKG